MTEAYLENIKKLFFFYKSLGEKAISRLTTEQLVYSPNENSNSIGVIIQHMHGNMLSRWTEFLTTDGEKPWRSRDNEFEDGLFSKEELIKRWLEGWACLERALDSISLHELQTIVYIRNEGLTVIDAIHRQLGHYSYHVGQIVYVAKQLHVGEWESLSIPKNTSQEYNKEKFKNEKSVKKFFDDQTSQL